MESSVANCVHCGTETALYESGVPICVACSDDVEASRKPPSRSIPQETRTDGPLQGDRFRIVVPSLGIREDDGHRFPTTIPTGGVITVLAGVDEETLIGIEWEGHPLRIYADDLKEHGEIVLSARTTDV
jgi:hypothetical protein